ncbi:YciI family protein [uncultured Desulfuromusa sp.]|uniref:YciI family protein n=1 Tax=uncultured Desulfuromusa sp. TaxID=219183 RepID=UPI002AA776A1|nr:YciI family protein [uncultured Desulfuromusa sp.]
MLFVVRCIDKKDHLPVRMENRTAHVEYLKSFGDKLFAAGGLLDDDEKMCGSVVIIDVADKVEAEAFAAGDPYAQAGLFEYKTIDRWNKVLP